MSDELTVMRNELALLPGGKSVELINAPLRFIAPALRVAAQCQPELDDLYKEFGLSSFEQTNEKLRRMHDEVYTVVDPRGGPLRSHSVEASHAYEQLRWLEMAKFEREKLVPRFPEVKQAHDLLKSIFEGGQDIDTATAMKMLSVLHRVLQKKKEDPITLLSYASLFDPDIDSIGASLNLWKEVPRHPVVVALAIQYLFHVQIFAPAPAELASACRRAGNVLKERFKNTQRWLHHLCMADVNLWEKDPEYWIGLYRTPASLEMAPVLGWCYTEDSDERQKNMRLRDYTIKSWKEDGIG